MPVVLVGTRTVQPRYSSSEVERISPENVDLKTVLAEYSRATFDINVGLATAIQCEARGWHELSKALWELTGKVESGHCHSIFYLPEDESPRTALRLTARIHWANELLEPDTDRAMFARRMKNLIAGEPKLDTEAHRRLLASLEAALVPSTAELSSPEALIDDLVNLQGRKSIFAAYPDPSPRYSRLVELGFDAVPALIEHLDDERLTRSVMEGFNNFPTYHRCVGEVVGDMMQGLAGDNFGLNLLQQQQGRSVGKAKARAWYKKALETGEEKYLLEYALPAGWESPNDHILLVLANKYPQHLSELYREVLRNRPAMDSHSLAYSISESELPRGRKIELFALAERHHNLEHRMAAFLHLGELDSERFVTMLVQTLQELPRTPEGPYRFCPESSFAHLVMETDDPRAWQALLDTAKRVDVGLRMELMDPMDYSYIENRQRRQRVEFLAHFLDDDSSRRVRNFAATQIASILELEQHPDRGWTVHQWAEFRTKVSETLDREKAVAD